MRFARMSGVPVVLACLLVGCGELQPPAPVAADAIPVVPAQVPAILPEPKAPSEAEVRELIRCSGKVCGFDVVAPYQEKLLQLGESAFPVYEAILIDPKSEDRMVALTCWAIARVQIDRRRFIPAAIKRATAKDGMYAQNERSRGSQNQSDRWRQEYDLTNRQAWARREPILLLSEIGDEREAAVLAPLLSDDHDYVRCAATEAVAKIGTHRELDALNACLKPGDKRRDANEMQFLTERRDELAKRLKEHPVPKTLTN